MICWYGLPIRTITLTMHSPRALGVMDSSSCFTAFSVAL